MDDLFKHHLFRLRQPPRPANFAESLLGISVWTQISSITKSPSAEIAREDFTEKVQVLESLERFAQEKLKEASSEVITVPGGEIGLKSEPTWQGILRPQNFRELTNELTLESSTLELTLAQKSPGQVKILFVPEIFRTHNEYQGELKEGLINQLLPAFPVKTAELFSRMLGAMKLEEAEVLIYPASFQDRDTSQEVMRVAAYYRPELIVTLGATPTHKILKSQERLAQVHGQFFQRKIENIGTFIVVPLFHPSIIENNQNMKKTAWVDMQKIMKQLKKL